MSNWNRTNLGKKCIHPGYKDHLKDLLSSLKDLYEKKEIGMNLTGDKVGRRTVVSANSKDIVNKVCRKRELEGTPNIIITIDGGRGFFKILSTILLEDYTLKDDLQRENVNKPSTSKRFTYKDGGTLKKTCLELKNYNNCPSS